MFKVSETSKRLMKAMVAFCLICLGVGVIVTQIYFPSETFKYVYGVIFGTIFALLKLILLERSLNKAANFQVEAQAQNYVRLHYMLRYFLTGVVMAVAAFNGGIAGVIGVFVSIFSLRPATAIVGRQYKKEETNV